MTALAAAPAATPARMVPYRDASGVEWLHYAPARRAPQGVARPESEARTLWAAPTYGEDSLAVVAFDDDGTDPYAGGMAYAFDLDGYSRADAEATFAREVAEACDFFTVVLIVDGEPVKVARGEG